MANRDFKDVQALSREVKILAFTVSALNGTPVATPSLGVDSISESSGDYTITLEDKYNSLLCAQVTLGATDGSQGLTGAFIESEDVNGAKTIVIDTTGTADANDRMHVALFLKNSSVA
jgi:hypothetical protein|tara:strand:- start:1090 stop:1443 length:354 start_codon:yes stop_codon:yes gene_type:complete